MTLRKIIIAGVALGVATLSARADAQLGALMGKSLGMPPSGEAGGAYQSDNQIRTYITSGPYDRIDLYGKAIAKAGEMTAAKGYASFGVTKHVCQTMLMNNTPRASSCYVIAVMLADGEQTKPRGKRPVQYYKVSDMLAGVIARPPE